MEKSVASRKMSFSMSLFMAVGAIIGAGIFAKTPLVIRLVGNGVVWGFFLAAIFVFFKTVPEIVMSSSLPANGSAYMHLTRLVHPSFGVVHAFNQLVIGTINVAILAMVFAQYFKVLVPSLPPRSVAVFIAVLFTALSLFGVKVSGWVQNVSVIVLLAALAVFIFGGIPGSSISIKEVLAPAISFSKLWAPMGLLHGSLIGANVLMYAADEIENPRRTIPIVFILSTLICALIFALMAFVSIGAIPLEKWLSDRSLNLASSAGTYLGPRLLAFFIVGGPLLAVATSINAIILMFSRSHSVAARDMVFPAFIARINKFGVPGWAIVLNSAIGVVAIISGLDLDEILLMVSMPGLVMNPVIFLSIFFVPRKYPLCYKDCFLRFPHWLNIVFVVIAASLSFLLGGSIIAKMTPRTWIIMVAFYAIAAAYTWIRWRYLKKAKGIDIYAKMREPYAPWIEREKELSAKAAS
ncbi:MAG: APC family permease [Spirochaetes bacterium]|nr:APC family permease [Spirochaetota bacterium]MBU1081438.1 APC family permease [Spirochaetota bacterium]